MGGDDEFTSFLIDEAAEWGAVFLRDGWIS
jgi:hypothetical protein